MSLFLKLAWLGREFHSLRHTKHAGVVLFDVKSSSLSSLAKRELGMVFDTVLSVSRGAPLTLSWYWYLQHITTT